MPLGKNLRIEKLISSEKKERKETIATSALIAAAQVTENSVVSPEEKNYPDNIDKDNLKISFIPSRRKTVKKITVQIEGDFTLNTCANASQALSAVFLNFDQVDFLLKNISQIDLSAVQLLHFIKTRHASDTKTLSIDADMAEEEMGLLKAAGFYSLLVKPKLTDN